MARISIPCSDALHSRLQKVLPWGTQAALVRRVLELTLDKIEQNGYSTIQMLISGKFNPLEEYEKNLKEGERK